MTLRRPINLFPLSVTSLTSVVHRCMNLVSPKEVVGGCKYLTLFKCAAVSKYLHEMNINWSKIYEKKKKEFQLTQQYPEPMLEMTII